jgi:hypothetical protein
MSRSFTVIACIVALSGCGEMNAIREDPAHHLYQLGAVYLGLDIVSLANTGKTIDDHILGAATGQDCNTVRLSQGGPYCIPYPPPVAMVAVTTYCYKSLASSTCYTAPVASDAAQYQGSRTDMVPAP